MLRKSAAILLTMVAVLAAGWLALRRPDIPYETLESSYSLAESRFLTVQEDLKLHYTDTGPRDAPVIVLVHGFASSLHTWLPWAEVLDDTYRVITLDLPGHGLSRVPDEGHVSIDYYAGTVDELMAKLKISRFSLAGSSMGGQVAWHYALTRPDRLDSLILVDAAGWPDTEGEEPPLVFRLLRIPAARILMKDLDLSGLIEDGLKRSVADPHFVSAGMADRYSALSRAPGHREALLRLTAGGTAREMASKAKLASISVPTLILWGEQDRLIAVSDAARFETAIPNAVAITYPRAGHLPQEEVAAESVADLEAFLGRHVTRAVDAPVQADSHAVSEVPPAPGTTGGGMRPR